MPIRRATAADTPVILALVQAIEDPPYYGDGEQALVNLAAHIESQPVLLDDVMNSVGWVHKDAARLVYTVVWLLPGSLPVGMTQLDFDLARARLLKACLLDAWTAAPPAERLWRIEARFWRARNAAGDLDGGEEAARKWRALFQALRPAGTRPQVQQQPDGTWLIWWSLQAAKTRLDLLV